MAYTILAAVDIGPMAEQVLSSAAVLARMLQVDVHVRHVSEHAPAGYAPSAGVAEAIERDEESLIAWRGVRVEAWSRDLCACFPVLPPP